MKERIKVAFASGPDDLNRELVRRMRELFPDLPLFVVSEFPPEQGNWIPYHVSRSLMENWARCRWALRGKRVRLAGVLLVPKMPYRRLRLIALLMSPLGFLAFNEQFDSFMLRPRSFGNILRHFLWRSKNFLRWQLNPGGHVYTFFWKLARPAEWRLPVLVRLAYAAGLIARLRKSVTRVAVPRLPSPLPEGVSVVIPSRDGRDLLTVALPAVEREAPSEIIVVDNGSSDGTVEFLRERFPAAVIEHSLKPLSFARAVNYGISRARYSHVCLINNDMTIGPGFFHALRAAFDAVPDLFCATAQIFFPEGIRREETGKAVMSSTSPADFPVRCEAPIEGEDHSYVLYGSGGGSLYDTAKLRALGSVGELYEPAYVEDLDLGYRGWLAGWPTVFVAGAQVVHRHRATTSRFYTQAQLDTILEINYLRFLCRSVASPRTYARLWQNAIRRLHLMRNPSALEAVKFASHAHALVEPPVGRVDEEQVLALASGRVAVFPGRRCSGKPVVLIASPYAPYPLSHGGAVRMYNLMRRAADCDQVLVCFAPELATPPPELLDICAEIVMVRLTGSHSRPATGRPDTVEEFDSPAFHAALRQTVRKWRPEIAQLEFTQMAQYAGDCRPAKRILVEHDVTFDLYEQLARINQDYDRMRELARWRRFEKTAWGAVDCVVTMSKKDQAIVQARDSAAIANGVDLSRFEPSSDPPEPRRLLFIGSFAHLPNVLALDFFLREVWQKLDADLHVIAGARHLEFAGMLDLSHPRIELEGFVADVRPAYRRAALVIAPLVASAGTNIKIMEAMAMGKAIVSTPAGVNGLDLSVEDGVTVVKSAEEMNHAITFLLDNPLRRHDLEKGARTAAERKFDWDRIAEEQLKLYRRLRKPAASSHS